MARGKPNTQYSILNTRKDRLAILALMLGATAIGFAPLLAKFAMLEGVGPTASAFWRFLLALPLLWAWSALEKTPDRNPASHLALPASRWLLLTAGILFCGDFSFWHRSIVYTTVANATFLANLAPIFVTLGAWLLWRQRITPLFLLGMFVALAGMGMLMGESFGLSRDRFTGDLFAMTTAVFYGSYQLCIKKLRGKLSTGYILARAHSVTTLGLLLVTIVSGEPLWGYSTKAWVMLVALAVVSHLGGQGLIAWSLGRLSAPFASVGLIWQPAMAALLAWWLLAEAIGPMQGIGCAVIVAGIMVARKGD